MRRAGLFQYEGGVMVPQNFAASQKGVSFVLLRLINEINYLA